jgi:hypothetical protein
VESFAPIEAPGGIRHFLASVLCRIFFYDREFKVAHRRRNSASRAAFGGKARKFNDCNLMLSSTPASLAIAHGGAHFGHSIAECGRP